MRLPDFTTLDVFNLDGTDSAECGFIIVSKKLPGQAMDEAVPPGNADPLLDSTDTTTSKAKS